MGRIFSPSFYLKMGRERSPRNLRARSGHEVNTPSTPILSTTPPAQHIDPAPQETKEAVCRVAQVKGHGQQESWAQLQESALLKKIKSEKKEENVAHVVEIVGHGVRLVLTEAPGEHREVRDRAATRTGFARRASCPGMPPATMSLSFLGQAREHKKTKKKRNT